MSSLVRSPTGALISTRLPSGIAHVELQRAVVQHAHPVGERRVDHAELACPPVDRKDVVDRQAEVVALGRLVVRREDVQLRVADAIPVDAEAEVRRGDALRSEQLGVEAAGGVLIGATDTLT